MIVASVGLVIVSSITGNKTPSQSQSSPSLTAPTERMPPEMLSGILFSKLNKDVQAKNETAFLSLVAPSAQQAVKSWWANQETMGFTTGAVIPAGEGAIVKLNSAGDGTMTVLAGTHNQLDPTGSDRLPGVPCEGYQIGLHFSGPAATGEIISWKPLENAPWDQGVQLYAAKSAHVEVVGDETDRALVNQTLPLAEAAAEYDVKLFDNINPKDLHMPGFVVFVSSSAAKRDTWFRSGPQPKGWTGDAFGGLTFPMAGASGSQAGIVSNVSDDTIGGGRVIVVPYQDADETPQGETQVLVHEFVHDILDPFNGGFYGTSNPVPAWADEGIARTIEDLYAGSTDPTPQQYNFAVLTRTLAALPASYRTGQLPSTHEIYGESAQTGSNWYDVGASVYEYIALKYGLNQMLASSVLLRTNDTVPFGNVLQSSDNGTFHFYPQSTIESGWKAWLAGL